MKKEELSKQTVDVNPYLSKNEDTCNKVSCPKDTLKDCSKEDINDELRERSAKARMQQNVDKAVVGYFKRHGTYLIINSAVAASVHGPCTLEECIALFKDCDPAIIEELNSLYAIIEQHTYDDVRREGYSSACKTYRPVNCTKYK